MKPLHAAFSLAVGLVAVGAVSPVFAQSPQPPARTQRPVTTVPPVSQAPVVVYQNPDDIPNARSIQEQLRRIMEAYPPSLRVVLQNDPSLLQRDDYLTPYPALALFLQQHPEVVRNPSFFFGEPYYEREPQSDRERVLNVVRNTIDGIGFLAGFLTVIALLYSLLRQTLEYRKWRRQIQIQTDIHTKLLDRMTNNQELLAYIETPPGRRFLEAGGPLALPSAAAATIAPVTRILWSVQLGVVLVAAGVGFWIARTSISDADLAVVFQIMGSLAMAVGVGFVVSALLSWALSLRMGLISAPLAKVE
jgi:hypothetical protein